MLRFLLILCLCGTLVTPGTAQTTKGSRPASQPAQTPLQTPSQTPLQDPELTVGTLSNGMRYYIRATRMPAGRAEIRFVVNAGSMQEDDDQQGFAHFMEHMAFNGTKHFPGNGVVEFFEKAGMDFGADLNAFTSYDETVYELTVPTDDPKLFKQAMLIVEDWARGDALLDSLEVVAERGVVMGEWRSRSGDTTGDGEKIRRRMDSIQYGPNARISDRSPIGKTGLLLNAQPGPIRRFYKDWYRPDLIAIVVVGDIDTRMVEKLIRERFGTIPAPVNPRPRLTWSPVPRQGPIIDINTGPSQIGATITWKKSDPDQTNLDARVRQELLEHFLIQQIQRRFAVLRAAERRALGDALLEPATLVRGAGAVFRLEVRAVPDSLAYGVVKALGEIERVAQSGISPEALDRQKSEFLRMMQEGVDAEDGGHAKDLANTYVWNYLTGNARLLNPRQEMEVARRVLPTITPETIREAAKFWRQKDNMIVQFNLPNAYSVTPPTKEELMSMFDSVASTPVVALDDEKSTHVSDVASRQNVSTPGSIVGEKRSPKTGIVEWTLSNGARVLFKENSSHADELLILAHSYGGFSALPDSLFFSPGRLVGKIMTEASGPGGAVRDSAMKDRLSRFALHSFRVEINHTEEHIALGGSPKELEALFDVLHTQFVAPKLDSIAVANWRHTGKTGLDKWTNANDQVARTLAASNPRLAPLSPVLVDFVTFDQAMAVYRDRFSDASDFTFTIVGAAREADVKQAVERFIASLPSTKRAIKEQPRNLGLRGFSGIMRSTERSPDLPASQSMSLLAYDGVFPTEPEAYLADKQRLRVLTWVLENRLRNELRERLSATYRVSADGGLYFDPQLRYRIVVQFDADPKRMIDLAAVMMHQIDSLRKFGPTEQELATAAFVQQRGLETNLLSNRYWILMLTEYDHIGVPFDRILDPFPLALTKDDLRAFAERVLSSKSYIQQIMLPTEETLERAERGGKEKASPVEGSR